MRATLPHAADLSAMLPYMPFMKIASKLVEAKASETTSVWQARTSGYLSCTRCNIFSATSQANTVDGW